MLLPPFRILLLIGFGGLLPSAVVCAAPVTAGNVTTALGPAFFFDEAVTGGDDYTSTTLTRTVSGLWQAGATVTLKGMGWASPSTGTTATSVTLTVSGAGPDGLAGTADDVVHATVTDALTLSAAASEYVWDFDNDFVFTATSPLLRLTLTGNGPVRRKTSSGGTANAVKLSLAGSATGEPPPPAVTRTATASGNWETVLWDTGSGTATGGAEPGDTVRIGGFRNVTYRGLPANEILTSLQLGESAAQNGQGTFKMASGSLQITGNITAGIEAEDNDAFVEAAGGTLLVNGDANFGTALDGCDGSLMLTGGSVRIDGGLAMGAFSQGGAMLRIHNPGLNPPLSVGGRLTLGRCALDLTCDAAYTHVPGTVLTLLTCGSRDGQFGNARRGQEINAGPHRFRIEYPLDGNSVSLTALPDWSSTSTRPNVVFILTDDQGYSDLQLNGHPTWAAKYPMPRLQALAQSGARFTNAYVTGGVCHPSRSSILTGRYQQRYGSENNLSGPSRNGTAISQTTIPSRLQALGYQTYGIGKWHLGPTVEFHPNVRGFNQWYGMWGGSRSYYDADTEGNVFQNQMTPVFADEGTAYLTDRIGDKAVAYIDQHTASHPADPFYMYISFTAVHGPNDMQFLDERFARLNSQYGLTAEDYTSAPIVFGGDRAKTELERYRLAGMTLAMDDNIGKVVDKITSKGLLQNTIFVYLSDNGGPGWAPGSGGNWSYNAPLRGYKGGGMVEGSIRVPAVMTWPGTIAPAQVIDTPVISLDFMATIINAGTAPAAARQGLDGLDLRPLLSAGTPLPADRVLTWRAGGVSSGGSAARMGDWKMLTSDPSGPPRLYNLRNDPDESSDLATSQPAILKDLQQRFLAWEARTLPPLYGNADTLMDPGLEFQPLSGGLYLRTASASPQWLSASFRDALDLQQDFSYSWQIRSSEPGPFAPAAALWQGLGDSDARSGFIGAGLRPGASTITLTEGKTGRTASAPLLAVPLDFATATLQYRAATRTFTLSLGDARTSLSLTGNYGPLTHFAMGVAAMAGELTTLRPDGFVETSLNHSDPGGFKVQLALGSDPAFDPRLERATDPAAFLHDRSALIESLGGARYQATLPTSSAPTGFFRFQLGAP